MIEEKVKYVFSYKICTNWDRIEWNEISDSYFLMVKDSWNMFIDEILMEWIKWNEAGVVWKADWRFQIYLNLWEVRSKI